MQSIVSSVNALHFPHVYFHKPVYVSTSSYICYLFWHVNEVAVIQFVAWGKVFIYSKVNTSAKKNNIPCLCKQLKRKVPNCPCIVYIQIQAMNHNEQQVHLCVLLMYTAN